MVKADAKVEYEGAEEPAEFTNFEELQVRVKQLQEIVDKHAEILEENGLVLKKETTAPYFDEDEVYEKLNEDNQ